MCIHRGERLLSTSKAEMGISGRLTSMAEVGEHTESISPICFLPPSFFLLTHFLHSFSPHVTIGIPITKSEKMVVKPQAKVQHGAAEPIKMRSQSMAA
ncbi:hypothetical protein Csa_022529, partial [Cucumis sativus]